MRQICPLTKNIWVARDSPSSLTSAGILKTVVQEFLSWLVGVVLSIINPSDAECQNAGVEVAAAAAFFSFRLAPSLFAHVHFNPSVSHNHTTMQQEPFHPQRFEHGAEMQAGNSLRLRASFFDVRTILTSAKDA